MQDAQRVRRTKAVAVAQLTPMLNTLRRITGGSSSGASDRHLLEDYLLGGGDWAFAALVERHGPMVLSVCRRVLASSHDADDAAQATFLILMQQAHRIVRRESVGSWL